VDKIYLVTHKHQIIHTITCRCN